MTALLEIQSLNKSFGGIKATDDLSLSVEKGELHAIIGPNGAGKTTLISQLSGAQRPDSGRILFAKRDITALPAYSRARLGIARSFQITSLVLEMRSSTISPWRCRPATAIPSGSSVRRAASANCAKRRWNCSTGWALPTSGIPDGRAQPRRAPAHGNRHRACPRMPI